MVILVDIPQDYLLDSTVLGTRLVAMEEDSGLLVTEDHPMKERNRLECC